MNCTEKVKDTAQLENEIENIGNDQDIEAYLCMNQESMRSFSLPEYLEQLLEQKVNQSCNLGVQVCMADYIFIFQEFDNDK